VSYLLQRGAVFAFRAIASSEINLATAIRLSPKTNKNNDTSNKYINLTSRPNCPVVSQGADAVMTALMQNLQTKIAARDDQGAVSDHSKNCRV
jgi:hypothetical protein